MSGATPAILAASGWLGIGALSGAVEKRLAKTPTPSHSRRGKSHRLRRV